MDRKVDKVVDKEEHGEVHKEMRKEEKCGGVAQSVTAADQTP